MELISERKARILQVVVEEYIRRGEPVSSGAVAYLSRLNLSPATVRNEMAELGEEGYLEQPHVSSGRVPSDLGYRYYVDHLMPEKKVPGFFWEGEKDLREIMRRISRALGVAVLFSRSEGDLRVVGLSALLSRKDSLEDEALAGLLDLLEEGFISDLLWRRGRKEVVALIGREMPDERMGSFSLLMGGERKRMGLLGPRRVDYALGFALLREVGHTFGS